MIHHDLDQVLLTEGQIQKRLDELAAQILREYTDDDLTLVAVLTGSLLFAADLLKRLPLPLRLDYIGLSSYRGATQPNGPLVITRALELDVADHNVLVVDDVLDTGRTLLKIRQTMDDLHPRRLKFCVFLEKEIPHIENFAADFVGFRIPNQFVVGYGLDYRERYRNLTCVATLKPEVIRRNGG